MTFRPDPVLDLTRPDAGSIVVSEWTVGTPERQHAAVEATIAQWTSGPWPDGLLSFNALVSVDGRTVLLYAQWTSDEAHQTFIQAPASPGLVRGVEDAVPGIHRGDLVRYRLHRSLHASPPPPYQIGGRIFVANPQVGYANPSPDLAGGPPGWISSHLHLSTDGSRMLELAEWASERAHIESGAGGARFHLLRSAGPGRGDQ